MKQNRLTSSWSKAGTGLLGLLAVFGILIAFNAIVSNTRLRADLTEEKLYTLSQGTRNILRSLEQDVVLKFYFNRSDGNVPILLKQYAKQIEDLLAEYELASRGRVSVQTYDPRPDSDAEEWAHRYGIAGQSVDIFGPRIYLGLVAVSGDTEAVIPGFDPRREDSLEYDLTRLIYRVTHPDRPRIGVMSSLPVLGDAPSMPFPGQQNQSRPAWIAFSELGKDYDVEPVDPEAHTIPTHLDALILIHPQNLPELTLFAVDQYLLGGGRLLVMVDPLSLADMELNPSQHPYGMNMPRPSDLDRLFTSWGVEYDPGQVVMDARALTRFRAENGSLQESPVILSLTANAMNPDDLLTGRLDAMLLPFAGSFRDQTGENITATPLINTSESSHLVDAMTAQYGAQALRNAAHGAGMPRHPAMRLTGTFQTAFPQGRPPVEDQDEESQQVFQQQNEPLTEGTSAVILIADVDFLMDHLCVEELNFFGAKAYRPLNNNLDFFANAVEQIAGSPDLIGIRTRGRFNRPFDKVIALEQRAREDWQAREEDLTRKLQATERQLHELQEAKESNQQFILSPEQELAIEQYREEELRIRRELKDVRKNLRREIEQLGFKVKALNIALMPVLVGFAGISYGLYRRKHREHCDGATGSE